MKNKLVNRRRFTRALLTTLAAVTNVPALVRGEKSLLFSGAYSNSTITVSFQARVEMQKQMGFQLRCCAGTNSRIALAQMNSQAEKARGHDNQRFGNLPLAENREGSCRDRRSP